jgi:hypothetical protein
VDGYEQEKWFELYRTAMLELQRAAMTGRISDARTAITARLEALKHYPGLHEEEHHAIDDAITGLRALEREEEELAAEDKRRALEETMNTLQSIAPKFRGQ